MLPWRWFWNTNKIRKFRQFACLVNYVLRIKQIKPFCYLLKRLIVNIRNSNLRCFIHVTEISRRRFKYLMAFWLKKSTTIEYYWEKSYNSFLNNCNENFIIGFTNFVCNDFFWKFSVLNRFFTEKWRFFTGRFIILLTLANSRRFYLSRARGLLLNKLRLESQIFLVIQNILFCACY